MAINKVTFGNSDLIDLTNDTVTASKLWTGYTAHDRSGSSINGSFLPYFRAEQPLAFDFNCGYIQNGVWTYEYPTLVYNDIYNMIADHTYHIMVGSITGTRFRAMATTEDVRTKTSGTVRGTSIINVNNPAAYRYANYTATSDGYIVIGKDNAGVTGLHTYVFDFTYMDSQDMSGYELDDE